MLSYPTVAEPFVFTEIEENWQSSWILSLLGCYFLQVFQNRFIDIMNLLSKYIRIQEYFQPIFRDFLFPIQDLLIG